ncbi:MAG TPA: hypothetical protein VFQ94_02320 [Gallionella sp.]|nr:hypothetical protein [Gallionella sp.]
MALLSRRPYDIKNRLSLAFEVKSTAAISEIGVVGNVVMGAVVTIRGLVGWFCIHRGRHLADTAGVKNVTFMFASLVMYA